MKNPYPVTILVLFLIVSSTCTEAHQADEDLPTFFKDKLNILALFGGLGLVVITTLISLCLCSVAEKRKERRAGLLDDSKDDD